MRRDARLEIYRPQLIWPPVVETIHPTKLNEVEADAYRENSTVRQGFPGSWRPMLRFPHPDPADGVDTKIFPKKRLSQLTAGGCRLFS